MEVEEKVFIRLVLVMILGSVLKIMKFGCVLGLFIIFSELLLCLFFFLSVNIRGVEGCILGVDF